VDAGDVGVEEIQRGMRRTEKKQRHCKNMWAVSRADNSHL